MTLQELYAQPDSWTQGALARDKNDKPIFDPDDSRAAKWCLLGGAIKCYKEGSFLYEVVLRKLHMNLREVITYNNSPGRTIDEIRDLVKELNI